MTDWPARNPAPPDRLGAAFPPARVAAYLTASALLLDLFLDWGALAR